MSISEMKNIDIRTVDPKTLVDRRSIKLTPDLPQKERLKQ